MRKGMQTQVTEDLAGFLAEVDTAFLATADASGQPYVQHRGGPKGFIRALDDHTLGLVDFIGNRQYMTAGNLAENDRVLLLLFDYEHRRRVKVWGTARRVPLDAELLARLALPGYRGRPDQALLITVGSWDVNCPQHIPRKVDAAAVERLEARVAQLELEKGELSAALRARVLATASPSP